MTARINPNYRREYLLLKLKKPTRRKQQWLTEIAAMYRAAVQHVLESAKSARASSRGKLHDMCYQDVRQKHGLTSDLARMAINEATWLIRSYHGLHRSDVIHKVSFPTLRGYQGFGLGRDSYQVLARKAGYVVRVSSLERRQFLWLPVHVPAAYEKRLSYVYGDARLLIRNEAWHIALPLRMPEHRIRNIAQPTMIGVDLGLVRLATVVAPGAVITFNGKPILRKREHHIRLREQYRRKRRTDRMKASGRKERQWVRDVNHKISRRIVDLATDYSDAVIALEDLSGIAHKTKGSKQFRRMLGSWAFKQLSELILYKAEQHGIDVVFVDPRNTSKTCHRCGHSDKANRKNQHLFHCQKCGLRTNADRNAAHNIAAAGLRVWQQGRLGTARLLPGQTEM